MKKFFDKPTAKKALLFTLAILPISVIAVYITVIYSLNLYSLEQKQVIIEQIGSEQLLIAVSVIQNTFMILFCAFFGYLLSVNVGLMKPFGFQKKPAIVTIILGSVGGMLLLSDYFVFARFIPEVSSSYESPITIRELAFTLANSVLYGGILEEIMLRLFVMSLISLIIKKIFFRKDFGYSPKIYIVANILSAILFGLGHLPATMVAFANVTAIVVVRCMLLNSVAGLIFGYLYRKYGIQYAMTAHILFHIVSKLIVFIFI